MPDISKIKIPGDDTVYNIKPAVMDITPTDGSDNPVTSDGIYEALNNMKMVVLSYGNSTWDDFLAAYTNNKVVYCRASSNSNPATGSQTRMAFLAYVNDSTNPTEGEFQYYRSINSHTDSTQGDEVYVYKINKTSGWSVTTRRAYTKVIAGTNLTSSFTTGNNSSITLNHATSGVTAGTYDTVTVDAQGHATVGSNSRVSNVTYDTTNSPVLKETIGGTDSTIETPDTTPTDSSKHLITSGAVHAPLSELIDNGAKNIAKQYPGTTSTSGISVEYYLDGSATFTCSNVASTTIVKVAELYGGSDTWVLSGCTGGSSSTYMLAIYDGSTAKSSYQTTDAVTYTGNVSGYILRVRIISGYTGTFTVHPMVCTKTQWDISHTYEPYALSNPELYMRFSEKVFGDGKILIAGDSLDDIVELVTEDNIYDPTLGWFRCDSATTAAQVISSPWTDSGYYGFTSYSTNSGNYVQIAFKNDDNITIAKRRYTGTWGAWSYESNLIDSVPTENSTNLVESGGVWSPVSELVDNGAKNVIKWIAAPTITNNVKFIPNSITNEIVVSFTSGTSPTSNTQLEMDVEIPDSLSSGTYVLGGSIIQPSGGLVFKEFDTSTVLATVPSSANHVEFNWTPDSSKVYKLYLNIGSTQYIPTGRSITYKPFICTKTDWDISQESTARALNNPALTSAAANVVNQGRKNYLNVNLDLLKKYNTAGTWSGNVYTVNDMSFTVKGDGTIIAGASGNVVQFPSENTHFYLAKSGDITITEPMVLSSGLLYDTSTYYITWGTAPPYKETETRKGVLLIPGDAPTTADIIIEYPQNSSGSGGSPWKPMLCTKAMWDVSHEFESYSLPNPILTAAGIGLVDNGVKNLLNIRRVGNSSGTAGNYYTVSGMTVTLNDDGTIDITSPTSSTQTFWLYSDFATINAYDYSGGDYVFSMGYSGGLTTLRARIQTASGTYQYITDNAIISSPASGFTNMTISFAVYSGFSGTIRIKPMICSKAQWDISQKFEPYALPNPTLTAAIPELIDNGAKNVFQFDKLGRSSTYGNTYTDNGVTFTLTADGAGITVSGTAGTGVAFVNLGLASSTPKQINGFCNGQYILSGGTSDVQIWARANSPSNYDVVDSGDGTLLSSTSYTGAIFVAITVPEGTAITTPVTVYPMICSKAQWDISKTYEPYSMTNSELTAQKVTMDDIYGLGTLIPNGSDLNDYTTPGSYYVVNNANANTITNKPIGGSGFRLIVSYTSATNRPRQEFIKPNQSNIIYVRNVSTDGNWTNWQIFDTVENGLVAPMQELVNNGTKNFIRVNFTTKASSSTTPSIRNNRDGSILINGSRSGAAYIPVYDLNSDSSSTFIGRETLPAGTYVCKGTGNSGVRVQVYAHDGTNSINLSNTYSDNTFEYTASDKATYPYVTYRLYIGENATFSDLTIYPMVCSKTQWDISQTYEQYALSNPTLTTTEIELVDSGAKNFANSASGSGTQVLDIPCRNIPPGRYVVFLQSVSSTDTDASVCQIYGTDSARANITTQRAQISRGTDQASTVLIVNFDTSYIKLYASDTLAHGSGDTVSYTGIMVCSETQWNISKTFVPYSPTNSELTDILRSRTFAFGTCSTAADGYPKVVTMSDTNWTRAVGSVIAVKFTNTNTFSATEDDKIKLSVNGVENEIYFNSAASPTGVNTNVYGYANRYIYYVWDGTYWVWQGHGIDNNTTYSSMSDSEVNAGTGTTARLITPARLSKAIRGPGATLATGADLNSYDSVTGTYYTSTAAIAKSCIHRPNYSNSDNVYFRLEVVALGTAYYIQKLYAIDTSSSRSVGIYYRYGYKTSTTTTWYSWRKVTDTTIADYTGT